MNFQIPIIIACDFSAKLFLYGWRGSLHSADKTGLEHFWPCRKIRHKTSLQKLNSICQEAWGACVSWIKFYKNRLLRRWRHSKDVIGSPSQCSNPAQTSLCPTIVNGGERELFCALDLCLGRRLLLSMVDMALLNLFMVLRMWDSRHQHPCLLHQYICVNSYVFCPE